MSDSFMSKGLGKFAGRMRGGKGNDNGFARVVDGG